MGGPAQVWAARSADNHCPLDTGHLRAEAWQPLSPARPSPPTPFQTLSCQKQHQPSALQGGSSGGREALKEASVDSSVAATQERSAVCLGHGLAPGGLPSRNPPSCFPASLPLLPPSPLPEPPLPVLSTHAFPALPSIPLSAQCLCHSGPIGTVPLHEQTALTACASHEVMNHTLLGVPLIT